MSGDKYIQLAEDMGAQVRYSQQFVPKFSTQIPKPFRTSTQMPDYEVQEVPVSIYFTPNAFDRFVQEAKVQFARDLLEQHSRGYLLTGQVLDIVNDADRRLNENLKEKSS